MKTRHIAYPLQTHGQSSMTVWREYGLLHRNGTPPPSSNHSNFARQTPIIMRYQVYVIYGTPFLELNVGNSTTTTTASNMTASLTTSFGNYTSGNGTSELLFAYTVGVGDATNRLDYSVPASDALWAPFGSILAKDTLDPVYLRSLPEPGEEGSLGWNKEIVISDEVLLVERVGFPERAVYRVVYSLV